MNQNLPGTFFEWERCLIEHFLKVGSDGNATDLRSFEITPRTLATAAGFSKDQESDAVESFRAMLVSDSMLYKALQGNFLRAPNEQQPNFFVYLALTLFIDSQLDGALEDDNQFRKKLAHWLGDSRTYSNLSGVASMWKRLEHWLTARVQEGAPFRKLVLPNPGAWKQIGHSCHLSFPSRTDVTIVERFLQSHPDALNNPRVVMMAFQAAMTSRASSGLRDAFGNFSDAYYRMHRALGDHPFWRLLTDVACRGVGSKRQKVEIERIVDEYNAPIFIVHSDQDGPIHYPNLSTALNRSIAKDSRNLGAAISRGLLFFYQTGIGKRTAEAELRDWPNGVIVAIKNSIIFAAKHKLGKLLPSGTWSLTERPMSFQDLTQTLRHLLPSPLERIYCPRATDGIRSHGFWLGRPSFLPRIDADMGQLVIRSETSDTTSAPLHIDGYGQLHSTGPVKGIYFIETGLSSNEKPPAWSLRLEFIGNSIPHTKIGGTRYSLEPLEDWQTTPAPYPTISTEGHIAWEDGVSMGDDLFEALYASGESGWSEMDIITLIRRANLVDNPWSVLCCLKDAGMVEARLRSGWRGREWTLSVPRIVLSQQHGEEFAIIEGALCAQQLEEFRKVVESQGGRCFRHLGIGTASTAMIGAINASAHVLSELFQWPILNEPPSPEPRPLSFRSVSRLANNYTVENHWDWNTGRFTLGTGPNNSAIKLLRLVHPESRDHDLYRVTDSNTTTHFFSRAAAVAAAHAAAKVPLFEQRENMLFCLTDEGLPDALATDLRRRQLRAAGFIDGQYAYPASVQDAHRLAKLLPGCVTSMETTPNHTFGSINTKVRHASGRLRPQWRNGLLTL